MKVAHVGSMLLTACFTACAGGGPLGNGGERDRPELAVSATLDGALSRPLIFRVTIDGAVHNLTVGTASAQRYESVVRAPRTGDLEVFAHLRDGSEHVLARASFSMRVQSSHTHWVAAHVGTRRPLGLCVGHVIALPLEPSLPTADSLFVMYGALPRGAVC